MLVRAACPHDCPDACGMLVTVENGVATKIQGDPSMPFTQGTLCTKVAHYLERTYAPDRLLYPLKRVGPKGSGRFERVSWDAALDSIAARLKALAAQEPQTILPLSYAGTMGMVQWSSMDRRFFHRLGASLLDRTICSTAGGLGLEMTLGVKIGTDTEHVADAQLILLWGTNTLTSNPHLWPFITAARKRGARVISIDPLRNRTAAQCDEWIGVRPGTDAALALGMMHVILREGLEDADYVARHTVGVDALRRRVRQYPPERVADICGIDQAVVERLAREYATRRPAFIRVNYGLQRHAGGGMAVRTIACLPALAGHWRWPAGGIQLSTSAAFKFNKPKLERPDLVPPGTRTINMVRLAEALLEPDAGAGGGGGPPIKALIVYNSNPGAVAPDRGRVRQGLKREDLFTVVLEHFRTDTADYADILLPATTQLEHWDIHFAYGHYYATLNQPAIPPLGEAKPNTEIFRLIAHRMGLTDSMFQDDDQELIRQALDSEHPNLAGVTFELLKEKGWARLNLPTPFAPFADGGFGTPTGKCEFYSERIQTKGLDPVPTFIPPRESRESNPELAERYPLALISPPHHEFLNSTFVNINSLRAKAGEPTLRIHPDDARLRGISAAAPVRVFNDRGAFRACAVVTEDVRRGVVSAPSIWWGRLTADGANANETTSTALTDLGGGATFYDNLVDVVLLD
ncbi:MAG: molybdopterin-containing oxidoreductase family protein [Gemmatimonadales bacterium]